MPNNGIKKRDCNLAIVTIPILLLLATVAISALLTEDVFAREGGRYTGDSTSQAAALSNECLNPILDSNTIDNIVGVGNCGGTISQQDASGSAAAPITSQTANPDIELQRAITTSQPDLGAPTTCEECFDVLTATQLAAFEQNLDTLPFNPQVTTIEQLCEFIHNNLGDIADIEEDIAGLLVSIGASSVAGSIIDCLPGQPGNG
jgi:hypothetical protein